MRKSKKVLAGILATLAALAALAACNEKKAKDGDSSPAVQESASGADSNVGADANVGAEAKIPEDFVFVEGGTFQMGSESGYKSAKPVHSVTVSGFYMCAHEVTQAEWRVVMGGEPSKFLSEDRPVESVSWFDAAEYCNRRSEKEGLTKCYTISGDDCACDWSANGYRLPTEAEWEFAARGGNKSQGYEYSGSNTPNDVAWCDDNSEYKTHFVNTKDPNELGLYNMSGNVSEWCWDWYGDYGSESQTDPRGASSGVERVRRGGGWAEGASICRVDTRTSVSPGISGDNLGFRVVRSR